MSVDVLMLMMVMMMTLMMGMMVARLALCSTTQGHQGSYPKGCRKGSTPHILTTARTDRSALRERLCNEKKIRTCSAYMR